MSQNKSIFEISSNISKSFAELHDLNYNYLAQPYEINKSKMISHEELIVKKIELINLIKTTKEFELFDDIDIIFSSIVKQYQTVSDGLDVSNQPKYRLQEFLLPTESLLLNNSDGKNSIGNFIIENFYRKLLIYNIEFLYYTDPEIGIYTKLDDSRFKIRCAIT